MGESNLTRAFALCHWMISSECYLLWWQKIMNNKITCRTVFSEVWPVSDWGQAGPGQWSVWATGTWWWRPPLHDPAVYGKCIQSQRFHPLQRSLGHSASCNTHINRVCNAFIYLWHPTMHWFSIFRVAHSSLAWSLPDWVPKRQTFKMEKFLFFLLLKSRSHTCLQQLPL